jgi:hypothetical protein
LIIQFSGCLAPHGGAFLFQKDAGKWEFFTTPRHEGRERKMREKRGKREEKEKERKRRKKKGRRRGQKEEINDSFSAVDVHANKLTV